MLRRQEQERLCNLDLQFMDKIKGFEAQHAQLLVTTTLSIASTAKTQH